MDFPDVRPSRQLFYLTACISLLAHLIVFLLPWSFDLTKPPERLNVRIEPKVIRPGAQTAAPPPEPETLPDPLSGPASPQLQESRPARSEPVLVSPQASQLVAEQPNNSRDINSFLGSPKSKSTHGADARTGENKRPRPTPRNTGRESIRSGNGNTISVETIPGGPPLDRNSMQSYLDSLLNGLYKTANAMHQPESTGHRAAAVRLRINTDGTLKSLDVIDEGDQPERVRFTRLLLEISAPYPPFPPALAASIKSLTINFCIRPSQDDAPDGIRAERGEKRSC